LLEEKESFMSLTKKILEINKGKVN
jgi:hypothetical protein